ncbi:MAG: hypothetical protein ABIG44_01380 [Planctomycetota bacterium]
MNIEALAKQLDASTARAFVTAARHVIDALMIEAEQVRQTQTPTARDYDNAELPRDMPGGGWLSHDELRNTTQRLAEAIAAEKWTDGVVFAVRLLSALGGGL